MRWWTLPLVLILPLAVHAAEEEEAGAEAAGAGAADRAACEAALQERLAAIQAGDLGAQPAEPGPVKPGCAGLATELDTLRGEYRATGLVQAQRDLAFAEKLACNWGNKEAPAGKVRAAEQRRALAAPIGARLQGVQAQLRACQGGGRAKAPKPLASPADAPASAPLHRHQTPVLHQNSPPAPTPGGAADKQAMLSAKLCWSNWMVSAIRRYLSNSREAMADAQTHQQNAALYRRALAVLGVPSLSCRDKRVDALRACMLAVEMRRNAAPAASVRAEADKATRLIQAALPSLNLKCNTPEMSRYPSAEGEGT